MRTVWQWFNEPVEYVGLADGIVVMAAGSILGFALASLIRWAAT